MDTLYEDQYKSILITCRSVLLRIKNVSVKPFRETQNRHFILNHNFSKIVPFMINVVKYCKAGQATDENKALAHCMLHT
jgi:hypothetical protein